MKRLIYIVTCFLTLVLFANAESKPAISIKNVQHQFFNQNVSGSKNYISADFVDFSDDLFSEDIDESDHGKNGVDYFAFLNFGDAVSFLFNKTSYKSAVCANGSHYTAHTHDIPLYILFHSMIIPS